MKNLIKTIFVLSAISLTITISAQTKTKKSHYLDLNIGSTSLGGGVQGYGKDADFPGYWTKSLAPIHIDLGYRKMFNSFAGVSIQGAFDQEKQDDKSKKFKANYYSLRLQGIINLVQALNSRGELPKFGILIHAGLGYTAMTLDKKLTPSGTVYGSSKNWDNMLDGIGGVTFQYKVGKKWTLNADASKMLFGKSQLQLDGTRGNHGRVDGWIDNYSIGTSILLGKNSKDTDFQNNIEDIKDEATQVETYYDDQIAQLTQRINDLEKQLASVNQNVVPITPTNPQVSQELLKYMFDNGLVNAYFDFNKDQPKESSNEAVLKAYRYLNLNPNAVLTLVGYADEIGSDKYNMNLSKRRAENVKNILTSLGVNSSRIVTQAKGEEKVKGESEPARSVVRRVEFKVN